jgi:hypothetical protein
MTSLDFFYGDYGQLEPAFLAAIDTSLHPRGPDMLYDVAAELQLLGSAPKVMQSRGEALAVASARSAAWSRERVMPTTSAELDLGIVQSFAFRVLGDITAEQMRAIVPSPIDSDCFCRICRSGARHDRR